MKHLNASIVFKTGGSPLVLKDVFIKNGQPEFLKKESKI